VIRALALMYIKQHETWDYHVRSSKTRMTFKIGMALFSLIKSVKGSGFAEGEDGKVTLVLKQRDVSR